MATLPGLRVGLTLDSATFVRETRRVEQTVRSMGGNIGKQTTVIERGFGRVNSAISAAKATLVGFGVAVGAAGVVSLGRQIIATSDQYAKLTGRISLAIGETENLAAVQERLLAVSQSTRQELFATSEVFTRLAIGMKDSGTSASDLLAVTESLAQAVAISGASTAEASAGLLQFSQGMSSGVLRGEELNSILEQIPRLAQAIAAGMDVPIGKLRELGAEGKLTTEVVLAALTSQAPVLAAEFAKVPITVGDAMTKVRNSFTVLVGGTDQATQSTAALAGALSELADVLSAPEVREGFQEFVAEGVRRFADSLREVQRLIQGVRNLAGAFVQLKDSALESVEAMVSGIEQALGQRMKTTFAASASSTIGLSLAFKKLYDDVVGNSYVPDMVDEIGVQMRRLNGEMVEPATKAVEDTNRAFAGTAESANTVTIAYDIATEAQQMFARSAASGISDAAFQAKSLGQALEDVARSFGKAIVEALAFRAIMAGIDAFAGSFGGTGGARFAGASAGGGPTPLFSPNIIPPGRAAGGPVSPGMVYQVGERGPEFFVPNVAGQIIPNGGGGGGQAPTIIINDQRGKGAPPVETSVDFRGVVTATIRAEVGSMARDGSLGMMTGNRRKGIARG